MGPGRRDTIGPPHSLGHSVLDGVEFLESMTSDDFDALMSDMEELSDHHISGLREPYESARCSLRNDSASVTMPSVTKPNLRLRGSNFMEHGYISGEMRVAIASLPGGPLGCSIEYAQRENQDVGIQDSEELSRRAEARVCWQDDRQFPVIVQDPKHLLSIGGQGRPWSTIPIVRNRSTVARAADSAHLNPTKARISRGLEEFPRQDPHFQPQNPPSASESRTWFRDIANRFLHGRMSHQHHRFHQHISPANKENIPIGYPQAGSLDMLGQSPEPGWPKGAIPPEVFENIAVFLPRDCLGNMRLVNKEFEFKISRSIFKHVVVPFTSQNFSEQRHRQELSGQGGVEGRTRFTGMHAFRGFGHHILKFGMGFEVDEATLINPPIKSSLEVVTTFWGTYKWPHQNYSRYEDVAGLENFADDPRKMGAAFSTLSRVMELGLSLDNGLGWLNGPDVPPRAAIFKSKPRIFGPSSPLIVALKRGQIESWRALLLAAQIAPADPRHNLVAGGLIAAEAEGGHYIDGVVSRVFDQLYPERATVIEHALPASGPHLFRETTPIMPNSLTMAQKEWLLETDWAQCAFLNSYCLAVIDNHTSFQNLHSFNIARLPSHYLSLLCRADFWSSIGNVSTLALNIIPEWREVTKLQIEDVEASDVLPSKSAGRVFTFLRDWIGPNTSIKTLSFGWVGGGEHAPGIYARNKNVMVAPLLMRADLMLRLMWRHMIGSVSPLLLLPHVENLTLSNCWLSPAALASFTSNMEMYSLKTLRLDSVSLSSGPFKDRPLHLQPIPGRRPSWAEGPFGPHPPGSVAIDNTTRQLARDPPPWPPVPDFYSTADRKWLEAPRPGSWVDVIEDISPGITLAELRHRFGLTDQPPAPRSSRIQRIEFESCGYILLLGYSFDQRVLRCPKPWRHLSEYLFCRKKLLGEVMMSTNDRYLGVITPYLPEQDLQKLQGAWGFEEGWVDDFAAADNAEDGQLPGGTGRFRGVIDVNDKYWDIPLA
ncbi:hypothetical protein FGG08_002394 [Glutinoglossum americanum]|uniref:F-box domain-containing protein n=1 Tax=Glutinoglossum americanum TaxID=1670608 RepID=A0A9P8KZ63_9PEZI|nr:hypothetical protein FGG08_002394 [Glutinoglossum americanum]